MALSFHAFFELVYRPAILMSITKPIIAPTTAATPNTTESMNKIHPKSMALSFHAFFELVYRPAILMSITKPIIAPTTAATPNTTESLIPLRPFLWFACAVALLILLISAVVMTCSSVDFGCGENTHVSHEGMCLFPPGLFKIDV